MMMVPKILIVSGPDWDRMLLLVELMVIWKWYLNESNSTLLPNGKNGDFWS